MTKRNQHTKRDFIIRVCDVDLLNLDGSIRQRCKGYYICHTNGEPVQVGELKKGQLIKFAVPDQIDIPVPT